MSFLIEIPVDNGAALLAEVEEAPERPGSGPAARPGEVAGKATESIATAIRKFRPAITDAITELQHFSAGVNEIELTFGLKLTAAAGMVIASSGVETHFQVKLKWVKPAATVNTTTESE